MYLIHFVFRSEFRMTDFFFSVKLFLHPLPTTHSHVMWLISMLFQIPAETRERNVSYSFCVQCVCARLGGWEDIRKSEGKNNYLNFRQKREILAAMTKVKTENIISQTQRYQNSFEYRTKN